MIYARLVETRGYPCQEHHVTTRDGYILGLQRIPNGRYGNKSPTHKRPPVLLQHRISLDAASWLLNQPDQALPFMLADQGFDVWLANTGGTVSSRGHRSLGDNDPAYWDWTWEQLAAYDLPAMFNFVNKQTGQKLHYVGHSLGTLTLPSALSQQRLTNLLRSAALLRPIAHLSHVSTPLVRVAAQTYLAEQFYSHGLQEFPPLAELEQAMEISLCTHPSVECYNRMAAVTGPNCCLMSPSSLALYYRHTPQSTSTKNVVHLSQMVRSGTVSSFDYSLPVTNMQHYRRTTPLVYNMANVPKDIPLFISFGGGDALSDFNDVKVLLNDLRNHDKNKFVVQYINEYAHLDFVFGWNANRKVYDSVLTFFRQH